MGSNQDVINDIHESIQSLWPEFNITREKISKPDHEFVVRFFTTYVKEFLDTFTYVLDTNMVFTQNHDLPPLMQLYQKVKVIFSKLNTQIFLSDLVNPNAKRLQLLMKVGLHFLSFILSKQDEVRGMIVEAKECKDKLEEQTLLKEEILEKIGKTAETLAGREDDIQKTTETRNQLRQEIETRSNDFNCIQSLRGEKLVKINQLNAKHEDLSKTIDSYKKTEEELLEKIVTDEEYDALNVKIANIQQRIKELSLAASEYDDGIEAFRTQLETTESIISRLDSIKLDVREEELAIGLKEKQLLEENIKNTQNDINNQQSLFEENNQNLYKLRSKLTAEETKLKALQENYSRKIATARQQFDEELLKNDGNTKKYQGLQEQITIWKDKLDEFEKRFANSKEEFEKGIQSTYQMTNLLVERIEKRHTED